MLRLLLIAGLLAAPGPTLAQAWGQPRPSVAPPPNPRLPVGDLARRVLSTPQPHGAPDPFAGPVRTVVYVVTHEIRVHPSEVVVEAPIVHFVTEAPDDPPPPSNPAPDTDPR